MRTYKLKDDLMNPCGVQEDSNCIGSKACDIECPNKSSNVFCSPENCIKGQENCGNRGFRSKVPLLMKEGKDGRLGLFSKRTIQK